jgi:methylmalonyl-CoA mutase
MDMTFNEFPVPTYKQWREVVEKTLKGKTFEQVLRTKLIDEIELEPMYQQKDLKKWATITNEPGVFPFLRGITNEPKKWKISQELTARTSKQLNEQMRKEFTRGQNVTHIVVSEEMKRGDKPKQWGSFGLTVYDLKDLQVAFHGVNLSNQLFHLDAGVVSLPFLAMFDSISTQLEGTIASDPLHQLAKEGVLTYSLELCYDYMALAVKWARENHPMLRTILVQSRIYHDGGASPAIELASSLATGVAYVNELLDRGVSPDEAGESITFAFSIGNEFFSEIAKIRAARVLWAAIMAEFGAGENGQKMNIHARTSSFTKTKQEAYVNLLRGTSEAFAAVAAGVDSLHVSPFDEALQEPTSFSRRLARNTSLILQEEAHTGITMDPAGGSWYVEHLTEQIAKKAWECFQDIEREGGIIAALKSDLVQTKIDHTWQKRLENVKYRRQSIVGVNKYVNFDEANLPSAESAKWREYFTQEKSGLPRPKTMEDVCALIRQNVPIHQVHELLQTDVSSIKIKSIPTRRLAEAFEELRQKSDDLFKKHGERPTVNVIRLGSLASHKMRVDFITELFQCGGFDVQLSNPVERVEEALKQVETHELIVLCGTNAFYQQIGIQLTIELVKKSCDVFIAGSQQEELANQLKHVGVKGFIHAKSNAFKLLQDLQAKMGGAN